MAGDGTWAQLATRWLRAAGWARGSWAAEQHGLAHETGLQTRRSVYRTARWARCLSDGAVHHHDLVADGQRFRTGRG